MIVQFNKRVLLKCLLTGIIMMITGMVLQVAKGQLITKNKVPGIEFIIGVAVCYVLMGFLFAAGFYIFRNTLPGKTSLQKGMIYSLFAGLIVLIPGILGLNAFDFAGLFNLTTPIKTENYWITAVDTVNLFIGGFILSKFFGSEIVSTESPSYSKRMVIAAGILGSLLLPLLLWIFHVLAEKIIPFGITIPDGARDWYYLGLLVPFVLTGLFLPLFYAYVKNTYKFGWLRKSWSFFLTIFVCWWIMNFCFILPFGYPLQTVLFYFIIFIPALLIITLLNGFILKESSKEVK